MLARPWESVPEASEDAAGMRPGGGWGIADVRGALTFVSLSPRVVASCGDDSPCQSSRGGTKRDFGVEDQRIARHPENSSTWKYKLRGLAQAATTFIQRPPNTFKHKIFFYLSMKATQDHFWFCFSAFFFFLEGIYICIYLQPCRYLHSQGYSVRNTKVLRKKTSQN